MDLSAKSPRRAWICNLLIVALSLGTMHNASSYPISAVDNSCKPEVLCGCQAVPSDQKSALEQYLQQPLHCQQICDQTSCSQSCEKSFCVYRMGTHKTFCGAIIDQAMVDFVRSATCTYDSSSRLHKCLKGSSITKPDEHTYDAITKGYCIPVCDLDMAKDLCKFNTRFDDTSIQPSDLPSAPFKTVTGVDFKHWAVTAHGSGGHSTVGHGHGGSKVKHYGSHGHHSRQAYAKQTSLFSATEYAPPSCQDSGEQLCGCQVVPDGHYEDLKTFFGKSLSCTDYCGQDSCHQACPESFCVHESGADKHLCAGHVEQKMVDFVRDADCAYDSGMLVYKCLKGSSVAYPDVQTYTAITSGYCVPACGLSAEKCMNEGRFRDESSISPGDVTTPPFTIISGADFQHLSKTTKHETETTTTTTITKQPQQPPVVAKPSHTTTIPAPVTHAKQKTTTETVSEPPSKKPEYKSKTKKPKVKTLKPKHAIHLPTASPAQLPPETVKHYPPSTPISTPETHERHEPTEPEVATKPLEIEEPEPEPHEPSSTSEVETLSAEKGKIGKKTYTAPKKKKTGKKTTKETTKAPPEPKEPAKKHHKTTPEITPGKKKSTKEETKGSHATTTTKTVTEEPTPPPTTETPPEPKEPAKKHHKTTTEITPGKKKSTKEESKGSHATTTTKTVTEEPTPPPTTETKTTITGTKTAKHGVHGAKEVVHKGKKHTGKEKTEPTTTVKTLASEKTAKPTAAPTTTNVTRSEPETTTPEIVEEEPEQTEPSSESSAAKNATLTATHTGAGKESTRHRKAAPAHAPAHHGGEQTKATTETHKTERKTTKEGTTTHAKEPTAEKKPAGGRHKKEGTKTTTKATSTTTNATTTVEAKPKTKHAPATKGTKTTTTTNTTTAAAAGVTAARAGSRTKTVKKSEPAFSVPLTDASLYYAPFEGCSQVCSQVVDSYQDRAISCRDYAGMPVPLEKCKLPSNMEDSYYKKCNPEKCGPDYYIVINGWTPCTRKCSPVMADGTMIPNKKYLKYECRSVVGHRTVPKAKCDSLIQTLGIPQKMNCNSGPCISYGFSIGNWGPCDCQTWKQKRSVRCMNLLMNKQVSPASCRGYGVSVPPSTRYCFPASCFTQNPPRKAAGATADYCKFSKCSQKGTCKEQKCVCKWGYEGVDCQEDKRSKPGCPLPSLFQADGKCCNSGVFDLDGNCCSGDPDKTQLDKNGKCCVGKPLDRCGNCSGKLAKFMDVAGKCCTALDANGRCCASGKVDECGVCDGCGLTCETSIDFEVGVGSGPDAQACINRIKGVVVDSLSLADDIEGKLDGQKYIRFKKTGIHQSTGFAKHLINSRLKARPITKECTVENVTVKKIPICGNGVCEIGESKSCVRDCRMKTTLCPKQKGMFKEPVMCSGNGVCTFFKTPKCQCFPGYNGTACADCADGFHRFGDSKLCVPGEAYINRPKNGTANAQHEAFFQPIFIT